MARPIIIQKYGGSSVANPQRIRGVARRVLATQRRGFDVVVVVSALGDATDDLLALAEEVTRNPSERELDMLMATGEQVSVALLAMAIQDLGGRAISFTGAQVGILTDGAHTKARIVTISPQRIVEELAQRSIVIVAGFQGMNPRQEITTLGRGGSDLTAVALAKALQAVRCEIYTDVNGVFTADPRIVPQARKLRRISYDAMLELASVGSQVLQARAVFVAKKYNIPMHVRSSFHKEAGTMIMKADQAMEELLVTGVAVNKHEAKITIQEVPDRPGIAAKIFKRLAEGEINVDMIVQNVSHTTRRTDISFTVLSSDLSKTLRITRAVARHVRCGPVSTDEGIAKISVVGLGMRSHSGVAAQMFEALARRGINIEMISTSEIKISCIVRKAHAARAVRALHRQFHLDRVR